MVVMFTILFCLLSIQSIYCYVNQNYWTRAFSFGKFAISNSGLATSETVPTDKQDYVINLTDKAISHLRKLKSNGDLFLRMGVKSGGCSGMSYVMDIVDAASVSDDDVVETFDDIKCLIDPKSLLYLYGLHLDYSDELIGGGFKFSNPNAETSW